MPHKNMNLAYSKRMFWTIFWQIHIQQNVQKNSQTSRWVKVRKQKQQKVKHSYFFELCCQGFDASVWGSVRYLHHDRHSNGAVRMENGLWQVWKQVRIETIKLNFARKRMVIDLMLRAAFGITPMEKHLFKLIPKMGRSEDKNRTENCSKLHTAANHYTFIACQFKALLFSDVY